MCGINGVFDPKGEIADLREQIAAMNRLFPYRGPDGEGAFVDSPAVLGMRRLAIIDLERGQQPLFNEDRSVVLVCNGEIYNHVELRARLVRQGHHFATASDCETIVHLYEDHGVDLLAELRGMFAFLLWDRRRKCLLAARDRLGLKPLYLARRGRLVAFSSELKVLIASGLASSAISPDKLYESLRFTYPIDSRRTLARDVERVPPGHYIIANEGGVLEKRYWDDDAMACQPSMSAEEVESVIDESVRLHLRSDVPVAVLLSGGLDSALVASYAHHYSGNLAAISAGYRGLHHCDERVDARRSAAQIGLSLIEVELDDRDFANLVPEIARHCDEPALDIAAIAQWALYGECRHLGFKVVLSGIGGDELFFGYPAWNEIAARLAPATALQLPGVAASHAKILASLGLDGDCGNGRARELMGSPLDTPEAVYAFIRRAYLTHNGLQLADKLGMGQSVEVRVPLVDHVLYEAARRLPLGERFSLKESKPFLRRVMRGRLPEVVRVAAKRGFEPPTAFVRAVVDHHLAAILEDANIRSLFPIDDLWKAHRSSPDQSAPSRGRLTEIFARLSHKPPASAWNWFLFELVMATLSWQSWTRHSGESP